MRSIVALAVSIALFQSASAAPLMQPPVAPGLISPNSQIATPMPGSPMMGSPMMGSPMMGSPMMGSPMMGSPMMGSPMMGGFGSPTMGGIGSPLMGGMGSPVMGGMGSPLMGGMGSPLMGGMGAFGGSPYLPGSNGGMSWNNQNSDYQHQAASGSTFSPFGQSSFSQDSTSASQSSNQGSMLFKKDAEKSDKNAE